LQEERYQVQVLMNPNGKVHSAQVHDTAYCWVVVAVFMAQSNKNVQELAEKEAAWMNYHERTLDRGVSQTQVSNDTSVTTKEES
jgi:hypothetical protein